MKTLLSHSALSTPNICTYHHPEMQVPMGHQLKKLHAYGPAQTQ